MLDGLILFYYEKVCKPAAKREKKGLKWKYRSEFLSNYSYMNTLTKGNFHHLWKV